MHYFSKWEEWTEYLPLMQNASPDFCNYLWFPKHKIFLYHKKLVFVNTNQWCMSLFNFTACFKFVFIFEVEYVNPSECSVRFPNIWE